MIKLGCDPEFFLKDKAGLPISAHNLVPGTKREPYRLDKGALQADGTAVEFNIDAASSAEEFAENITTVLNQVREFVPKEYEFDFSPTVTYPKDYFDKIPESAKELGCDPDFDAWKEGEQNPRPTPEEGFRTASGHLHIGWTDGANVEDPAHLQDCLLVVRRLDYLFHPISPLWETNGSFRRRGLYGDWGAFRPKPYGVEYRVLDNSWLKYPKLWPWLFDMCSYAFKTLEDGYGEDDLVLKPTVIDHSMAGHEHYGEHGTVFRALLQPAFVNPRRIDKVYVDYANQDLSYICKPFTKSKPCPKLTMKLFD